MHTFSLLQSYELLMKCPYFFLDVFYAHETPSQKNECHVSAHVQIESFGFSSLNCKMSYVTYVRMLQGCLTKCNITIWGS